MTNLLSRRGCSGVLRDWLDSEPFESDLMGAGTFNVNVYEDGDVWTIEAALPGVSKEDITLDVSDGIMTISVEKKNEKRKEDANYTVRELSYGKLSRAFRVARELDAESAEAELKDGILTVKMSKSPKAKIEIK